MSQLWEILVPRARNDGTEIEVAFHRAWDEQVRKIAGGLTILKPARGIWESPGGEIYREGMIPVRIACTEAQIEEVIDLTFRHYDDQLAITAHRVSDYVIIRHRTI